MLPPGPGPSWRCSRSSTCACPSPSWARRRRSARPARRSSRRWPPAWWTGGRRNRRCPVEIRHPLVRDAVYAGITATRRRVLHARAATMVSEPASWEHRVAALDQPGRGPGRRAGAAGRRGGRRRPPGAGRHPPAVGVGHLPGPGRPGAAAADRGAAPDAGRRGPRAGPARGGGSGGAVPAAQLRAGHDGVLLRSARRGRTAASARRWRRRGNDPDQPAAGRADRQPAGGHLHAARATGRRCMAFGRWALGTGCLDAAAASQTRTLIAIGASQVAGPRAALAELGHLDADPARVGPVDVDGLSFRGVFRLLAGDLGQAVARPDRQPAAWRAGAPPSPSACAPTSTWRWPSTWPARGTTCCSPPSRASPPPRSIPAATSYRCCTWRRAACRPGGARPRRPSGTPGWPRRRRPAWTTARNAVRRRWPGPWCTRRSATTWAWPTRWVPGRTTRPWTAAAGCTRCCGGRCWSRAWSARASSEQAAAVLDQLRRRHGQVGYLRPALAWLEGWLAEQRGDLEEARRIYADGEESASTQQPGLCGPAAAGPRPAAAADRPAAPGGRAPAAGERLVPGACAPRRSSPGSKRSWPPVTFPATRRRSSPSWR